MCDSDPRQTFLNVYIYFETKNHLTHYCTFFLITLNNESSSHHWAINDCGCPSWWHGSILHFIVLRSDCSYLRNKDVGLDGLTNSVWIDLAPGARWRMTTKPLPWIVARCDVTTCVRVKKCPRVGQRSHCYWTMASQCLLLWMPLFIHVNNLFFF